MKVNPAKYDYVMYVDASGDDGFKFEKDSSSCYCAAALLVKQEDILYNLDILKQIKKIVGCKETDEIKYSKIRRHKRGADALGLLSSLKGRMSCYLVFKKELPPEKRPDSGSKELSVICHIMAMRSMEFFQFSPNEKTLIAIDRMKNTEEEPLGEVLKSEPFGKRLSQEHHHSYDVIFRDSKDANFLLIQIADLLCGTIREHFEQYETNEDMLYFKRACPPCVTVWLSKKGVTRKLCKNARSRAHRIIHSKNLHNVLPLFPVIKGPQFFDYFFVSPLKMMDQHTYLYCERI